MKARYLISFLTMTEDHHPPEGLALLVLDMQETFVAVCDQPQRLTRRVRFAIEAARLLKIPIIFTEQVPAKLGATQPQLLEAAAGDARQIAKHTFSALRAEELTTVLLREDINHLLVAGVETSVCVYQTILDCLHDELQVTLLTDCHGARRPADAVAVLNSLQRTECNLLPAETIFYSILGSAEHPAFKAFTSLVKGARQID